MNKETEKIILELVTGLRMCFSEKSLCSVSFYEYSEINSKTNKSQADIIKNAKFFDLNEPVQIIKEFDKSKKDRFENNCIIINRFGAILIGSNPDCIDALIQSLEACLNNKIEQSDSIYHSLSGKKKADTIVSNKIAVITGGSLGFGEGIARDLFLKGANVVIADINEKAGSALVTLLNETKTLSNKALFVQCDVSEEYSVRQMVQKTVLTFGGLDIFISNAGILRSGSLSETDFKTFELITKINYSGYFLCTKYASEVMKLQHKYAPDYFMDIIQVNSKSGLKGSNKNSAYAGENLEV